ncbi:MAG: hypothetical protein U5P41_12360 [Gammaproteobacteria bacterium]|nr:hypothetical protein [Gammaproteobacteria bacterium]
MPIEYGDRGGWESDDENPLWRTHVGGRLYDGDDGPDSYFTANDDTPDPTFIFSGILDALDTVFELMADIASFLNIDVGFQRSIPTATSTPRWIPRPRPYRAPGM